MSNLTTMSVAQGIAYLDFGFIEPALTPNPTGLSEHAAGDGHFGAMAEQTSTRQAS